MGGASQLQAQQQLLHGALAWGGVLQVKRGRCFQGLGLFSECPGVLERCFGVCSRTRWCFHARSLHMPLCPHRQQAVVHIPLLLAGPWASVGPRLPCWPVLLMALPLFRGLAPLVSVTVFQAWEARQPPTDGCRLGDDRLVTWCPQVCVCVYRVSGNRCGFQPAIASCGCRVQIQPTLMTVPVLHSLRTNTAQ